MKLNDEETLLNEIPDIFRKAPPIRPRGDEPEEIEERKGKMHRFASNRMENEDEKDDKDIYKQWTTADSRIELRKDAMENATVILFQKDGKYGDQEDGPRHEDTRNNLSQEPAIMEIPADVVIPLHSDTQEDGDGEEVGATR